MEESEAEAAKPTKMYHASAGHMHALAPEPSASERVKRLESEAADAAQRQQRKEMIT